MYFAGITDPVDFGSTFIHIKTVSFTDSYPKFIYTLIFENV
jgi:hypothetical protein